MKILVAYYSRSGNTRKAATALAGRLVSPPVYFTGGVALQPGMTRALEEVLACPVRVAPQPQFTGALGAALSAKPANNGGL